VVGCGSVQGKEDIDNAPLMDVEEGIRPVRATGMRWVVEILGESAWMAVTRSGNGTQCD
jgi:hypothetical protein